MVVDFSDITMLSEVLRLGFSWLEPPVVIIFSATWDFFYIFSVSSEIDTESVKRNCLAKAKE